MPLKRNADLPEAARNVLPDEAQDVYRDAYNRALEEHGGEQRAHEAAWAAVKDKFVENERTGRWLPK